MGLYITLRDADGAKVRDIPDPFGGTFDASGDFDDLLGQGASSILDAIGPNGVTTLASSEMSALGPEVDALLATIPESRRGQGRAGTAWRGLTRFRAMIGLCGTDSRFVIELVGD
ncbi:hypothetical protein [Aeromicrobium sp.]|uniref:hypothetical protein n=1 Tax=Aeromicrobium sp. TaxID=1871063 RepID=UPI002FCC8A2E